MKSANIEALKNSALTDELISLCASNADAANRSGYSEGFIAWQNRGLQVINQQVDYWFGCWLNIRANEMYPTDPNYHFYRGLADTAPKMQPQE